MTKRGWIHLGGSDVTLLHWTLRKWCSAPLFNSSEVMSRSIIHLRGRADLCAEEGDNGKRERKAPPHGQTTAAHIKHHFSAPHWSLPSERKLFRHWWASKVSTSPRADSSAPKSHGGMAAPWHYSPPVSPPSVFSHHRPARTHYESGWSMQADSAEAPAATRRTVCVESQCAK